MKDYILSAFADESSPELGGQIDALKRNGFTGLELRNVDGQNVSELSLEKAKEIHTRLSDEGLMVWSAGSPLGKIGIEDAFEPHLDTFRHTLEVCHALGAERIRLFSFFLPKGDEAGKWRNAVMDRLFQFVEAAKGSGITLCHENEKGIYGDIAPRCADIHRTIPELKAVFDPANYVQCAQETLSGWEEIKPYIHYMHIKDALPDGSVVPPGRGAGNVPAIVKDYVARGGRAFTVEPHLTVFKGLSALEREGQTSNVGKYAYPTPEAAFDTACTALKSILAEIE